MTVFDASVLVDALVIAGSSGDAARAALRDHLVLQVPAVLPAEATSAIRALRIRGTISAGRAAAALEHVRMLRAVQFPFEPFIRRAWELRDTLTVYDVWYVALAEELGTTLVTADRRLAQAPGPRCPVEVL